jgi:hypothetical protein
MLSLVSENVVSAVPDPDIVRRMANTKKMPIYMKSVGRFR